MGTKLETADTAKGIPTVTRHSLTLHISKNEDIKKPRASFFLKT
jgi:hypothetical protein